MDLDCKLVAVPLNFPFVLRPGAPAEEVPQEAARVTEIFWALHGCFFEKAIGQGEAPAQTIKAWRIWRLFFSAALSPAQVKGKYQKVHGRKPE